MAEAYFQVLIDNLSSEIQIKIGLVMGVHKEMKRLANTLKIIQKVLGDAEDNQFPSQLLTNWLQQVNGLAYDIEDLVDECNKEFLKLRFKGAKYNLKVQIKYKIGRKMSEAAEELDAVAEDRLNFHLKEIVLQQLNQGDWRRETGSVLNEQDHIYGRDDEREYIVDVLVNQVSEQRLSVLPIIGGGGIGKTTLAQFIFNDERITRHFNSKIWVSVSDRYYLKDILKAIKESVTGNKPNLDNLDDLQRRLRQELNEKRYLLILDDVWNEYQEDWDKLKGIVECGSMGSSIVVTTRMQKVAYIMGTIPSHRLKKLSEEHCWLLFKRRAFGQENGQGYSNLETIGLRIAKKCAGVPLAATILGGILRFQRDEKEWIHVEESHLWNSWEEEHIIFPALRLSYFYLPIVLKRCFAYCAVFPYNHVFDKTTLIFHWMAHSCITSNETQEVENVGEQVWNELASRSFFQEVRTLGREITFKMHDLVHDLAQSIMEDKIPWAETESSRKGASNSKIHQVSYWEFPEFSSSSNVVDESTLSTIINYSRLRILKQEWISVEELPCEIGNLKHMRCFTLSRSSIRTLPHTFCHLFSLQILILIHCSDLHSLPSNFRYMTNLRHVILEGLCSLSHMPSRIRELASLKTLTLFIVGDTIGNQLDELEHLNLGGRLEIQHLERVQNHLIAKKANLVEKSNLHELVLCWEGESGSSELANMMELDEKVLEALEPHPNLVTLEIHGFRGRDLGLWMKSMKNITHISIEDCRYCRDVSPLGDVPLLNSLSLKDLETLEYIVEETEVGCQPAKFASLEKLDLRVLPNLKGWLKEGEVVEIFPNLQTLHINSCGSLRLTSSSRGLNSVTKLELWYCKIGSCFPEGSFRNLIALKELQIWNSTEVEDHVVEEMKHLHFLIHLLIAGAEDMVSLPKALQHIPSLQSLTLNGLCQLASLTDWLPNLPRLRELEIKDCPTIPSLPSSIQGMANLKFLTIEYCPQLKSRCQKENGEDWHKISHIPYLNIQ